MTCYAGFSRRGWPREGVVEGHTFAADAAGGDGDIDILRSGTCAAWRPALGQVGCCHREFTGGLGIAKAMVRTRVGSSSRSDLSRPDHPVCRLLFFRSVLWLG